MSIQNLKRLEGFRRLLQAFPLFCVSARVSLSLESKRRGFYLRRNLALMVLQRDVWVGMSREPA